MSDKPVFLYVEDDPLNRDVMRQILGALGFPQVHLFRDTTDFITRFDQLSPRPTFIFLDIHIDPCDGFEVINQLRARDAYRSIPVIAITASIENALQRLQEAGFDGCISKPISWQKFPTLLHRILQGETVWNIT